jgi:putative flavoprotein involved in K+ transport
VGILSDLPGRVDTVVIGAGQAGLSMSHELTVAGREHVVLEARDRLGGSWLKRWDSFCLVTPNFSLRLPGYEYAGPDPDGFLPRDGLIDYVASYAGSFDAPLVLGTRATGLDRDGDEIVVETSRGMLRARNAVLATGAFQVPKLPPMAERLPAGITQLHTDAYRNEALLPPGAVLVVGTGQSGCQVAEELHQAGRRVYLAVSSCWRAPRRYRGRDIVRWIVERGMRGAELGLQVDTVDDLPDPRLRYACNPQLTGKDGGHSINLRRLGADGVTLLGHLADASDGRIALSDDLAANLLHADTFFDQKMRPDIDAYIQAAGIDAPPYQPDNFAFEPPFIPQLDLAEAGITTVIWATGYRFDFGWVRPLTFDATGYPRHRRGVTEVPGLYLLGLPWLHTFASSIFAGVGRDATYLAGVITGQA